MAADKVVRSGEECQADSAGAFVLAASLLPAAPAPDESAVARTASKWLFLMQHFGLPTRLLDWTESPLIAAFFAATEHEDVDGAVWALDTFKLNRAEGNGPNLAGSWNDEVLKVLLPAFNREMGPDSRILAILPTEVDVRMLTLLVAFTIHGRMDPLNSAREAPVFLMRFTIPSSCKHAVRDGLRLDSRWLTAVSMHPTVVS